MDYVENLVVDKLKSILKNLNKKDEMINTTRQKLKEQKDKSFSNELKEYKDKLSKISLEVDSIYNDKLNGILSQDDFTRIYERKKEEKIQIQNRIQILESYIDNNLDNEDELINKLINKFKTNLSINREILIDLVNRIEIDKNKKIYIFFKFKSLNSDS